MKEAKVNLSVKQYPKEGYLQHTYSPLRNLLLEDNTVGDFTIDAEELNISGKSFFNIECQPSYDGTVNLILNDDVNPPKIINTRFTKKENDTFKVINRNQIKQSNLYEQGKLDQQTRLIRNINFFPKIDLLGTPQGGYLKGGNYTLYVKYVDSDYNESEIVCESGQISIFKGSQPTNIQGTLSDEISDKSIKIVLSNLDTTYNMIKLYVVREYSDLSGTRQQECFKFSDNITFSTTSYELTIVGTEVMEPVDISELNIMYHSINSAKTQAQVQNMLFFGNIEKTISSESELQNVSYFIEVMLKRDSDIGWVSNKYSYLRDSEYYNTENIYYRLGYWPDEYYKLGIVYILNDDTVTPAFPLRGCAFQCVGNNLSDYEIRNQGASNLRENYSFPHKFVSSENGNEGTVLTKNVFLSEDAYMINTFGVFKTPKEIESSSIINGKDSKVQPLYFEIKMPEEVLSELKRLHVKGYFFVRQKRIPTILGQGVSLAIDRDSYSPMLKQGNLYFTEGLFVDKKEGETEYLALKTQNDPFQNSLIYASGTIQKKGNCLLCVDADCNPSLQSTLDGSDFVLENVSSGSISNIGRHYSISLKNSYQKYEDDRKIYSYPCVYVNSGTKYKFINDWGFSTQFGSPEATKDVSFFGKEITITDGDNEENEGHPYHKSNKNVLRGLYTNIIGVCGDLEDSCLYNIKIPGYSDGKIKDYFTIRKNDQSPFFAISDRYLVTEPVSIINVHRGDCYSNTITVRLNRNFTDPNTPINDTIVDPKTWAKHYKGYMLTDSEEDADTAGTLEKPDGKWTMINLSDLNAVGLGMWLTYKCLSSYNLGLRSEDRSHTDEFALTGSARSFYPLSGINVKSATNVEESKILNKGFSATVGAKSYIQAQDLPYVKELFDNRIMFSNVQVEDDFKNGYRVFQGLSYKDIDRQYGAIVKLLPWGTDLLCVFEHGIAIVPVNQKALMSTTTGQSIHMYGAGVLQSQVSLITGDYGSIWQESIIRTPIGVYGVDTFAKKIWRYSENKGFETISDMTVQRFLNDHILLNEHSSSPMLALKNVKSHYNNYKGDVMFTFYNYDKNEEWNLCYNERLGKWITRYSWIPLYSENINNVYFSFDKHRSEILSHIDNLSGDTYGLKCSSDLFFTAKENPEDIEKTFYLTNTELEDTRFIMKVNSIETSYLNDNDQEITIKVEDDLENIVTVVEADSEFKSNRIQLSVSSFISKLANLTNDGKLEETFPINCPLWYKLNVSINCFYGELEGGNLDPTYSGINRDYTICLLADSKKGLLSESSTKERIMYDKMFINGVYVHGRAGIFDEINYTDDSLENQILPTKWYDKQEPFEFEFIVNDPIGIHKVFENLMIVSNNVAPEEIQFEIEGDAYSMWKINGVYNKDKKKDQYKNNTLFQNASVKWDTILNQYSILMSQECKSIEKFGRRLGNMHYKEDAWYITINPLLLNKNGKTISTKLRDKYLKVRVRYSGTDLAVITAIKTSMNLSHS